MAMLYGYAVNPVAAVARPLHLPELRPHVPHGRGRPRGASIRSGGALARIAVAAALLTATTCGFLAFGPLSSLWLGIEAGAHGPDTRALFLVRSTLMALNDANRSGNYSVLRDLAGPRFRQQNPEARLREVFRGYREANADLSRVAMTTPALTSAQVRAEDGVLALDGSVDMGEPGGMRLRFQLEFEDVAGHWRLLTLGVSVVP